MVTNTKVQYGLLHRNVLRMVAEVEMNKLIIFGPDRGSGLKYFFSTSPGPVQWFRKVHLKDRAFQGYQVINFRFSLIKSSIKQDRIR